MPALIEAASIRPSIFAPFSSQLVAGMSTRHGGVSKPPYAALNLANSGPDSEQHRNENRRRFCAALGCAPDQLVRGHQVHGIEVLHATQAGVYEGYDAFMTQEKGLLLAVSVADCVPILIYDQRHHAVAAVHAGWKGTAGALVHRTLVQMQAAFGTQATDCFAYIGPCIDRANFEVGPEVAEQFGTAFKTWDEAKGKHFVDLKAANAAQLLDWGVPAAQVEVSSYSTVTHNAHFFSHRFEGGQTGRLLAAIGVI